MNTLLRVAATLILSIAAGASGLALAPLAQAQSRGEQADRPSASEAQAGEAEAPQADEPAAQDLPPDPLLEGLHAAELGDPEAGFDFQVLGSMAPDSPYEMEVAFSRYGAGIRLLQLTDYYRTVVHEDHLTLQQTLTDPPGAAEEEAGVVLVPFSVEAVEIEGRRVPLQGVIGGDGLERRMWREEGRGHFRALIVNGEDQPVLEIERIYELQPQSYELTLRQRIRNLTDRPLDVVFIQYGPADPPQIAVYPGDRRRMRYGYLLSEADDPSRLQVFADDQLRPRGELLGKAAKSNGVRLHQPLRAIWPTERAERDGWRLSWIALSNRYFAVAALPLLDPDTQPAELELEAAASVDAVVLNRLGPAGNEPAMALRLTSQRLRIAAAGEADLSMAVYAGPLHHPTLAAQPWARMLRLDDLVVYSFGGFCAVCTFAWLTAPIFTLLKFLHDYLLFDWALAIMALVVIVRGILHPVTRWSQIRMQLFQKQMQAIAPKQKKLQERFGHDKQRMQQEMARLWREEGISPAGLLGCLPMFLQSPVWIALYATLYYAFELRNQPAFFGVLQSFGNWSFLADLSEPDRFIWFRAYEGLKIPLIATLMGPINSINVLPVLLGVVFFVHQKYLTPPSSATMTPEQEQQQKIMKVMMVVMFPVIMYNAPSGLAIYFITNSTLGIIESRWIRGHIEKHDLLNPQKLRERRKRKPGLVDKLRKRIEHAQKMRAMQKQQQDMPRPGMRQPSKKQGPPQRYKKRK